MYNNDIATSTSTTTTTATTTTIITSTSTSIDHIASYIQCKRPIRLLAFDTARTGVAAPVDTVDDIDAKLQKCSTRQTQLGSGLFRPIIAITRTSYQLPYLRKILI